jgi:glycosyltransferase involved in cell wall biosynthesis
LINLVLAVTNDIVTDNRVHKVAVTLQNNGYKVTVVGIKQKQSESTFGRSYKTRRFTLWFNKSALFYANYNIRLFFYLLKNKFDIIVSNDLDTLLGCWLATKIQRNVLVFDSHELFIEVPELVDRPVTRSLWHLKERLLMPSIKYGYSVSQPIIDYYKNKYKKDFELIRNVGYFREEPTFKGFSDEVVIIYQGSVNIGRGLELMLMAMQYLSNAKLWIIGRGDITNNLKKLAVDLGVEEKIIFFGLIAIENLTKITSQAHIGISLEEDLGLNYRYALPNKIFDYIQSRVPVIVSDLPEMSALVEKHRVGIVLKERTPENLAQTINHLILDTVNHEELAKNLELAARDLCWHREEEKLINLYRKASEQVQVQNG